MEILNNLLLGFSVAVSPIHLLYALIGVMLGTLIGVLPGVGPVATIAMLLPITFNLSPIAALIMLAGIYYGAQYGGSTTAILVNLPGESASVVTCIDGYQMARQGRAGPALATAALGSFFAGCVATLIIAVVGAAAGGSRAQVRPGGILLADGAGPGRRHRAGARLAHQGDRHGGARPAAGPDRHRRQFGRAALHLRRAGAVRRHRLRRGGDGHVRHRGDHRQPGAGRAPRGLHRQGRAPDADQGRLQARLAGGAARHRARLVPRHPARRRRAALVVRRLHGGEEALQAPRAASARARSRAWPGPRPPTTPARRPPSSRCSRSASRATR